MGTNYYAVSTKPTVMQPIHIGKSSLGWKFCFHEIDLFENWVDEKAIRTFPQMKKFLEDNIKAEKIVLMNEYNEVVDLNWFLEMVAKKQKDENDDNFTYSKNIDSYRFESGEFR